MASIRKRGSTYQIRVSAGYDITGKQLTKTMTWKPSEKMTEKQIEKELNRQATLFEEKVMSGLCLDCSMKLAEFIEIWFRDYAEKQLRQRTIAEYRRLSERIMFALGHHRLNKIQPHHLIAFYSNLSENGIRKDIRYKAALDFADYMKRNGITRVALADAAQVSRNTITVAKRGGTVAETSAKKIMRALNDNSLFSPINENAVLSPTTIAKYHTLLSSILSTAVQWQILLLNPCDRVQPPKKARHEECCLDDVQAVKLVKCLEFEPLRYRTMIMLLLYSGMRRGELCGLTWSDIDFKHNLISITKANLYLPGKGIFEDSTKNKTSDRVIQVPADMIKLLQSYRAEQAQTRLIMGDKWQNSDKIFTTPYGAPIHPDTVSGWFRDFIERHNLPKIHLHSLRHTNATLLIANGTNIRTVAKRLGHSTPTTTTNIYAHAIKTADELASEKLADIFSSVM